MKRSSGKRRSTSTPSRPKSWAPLPLPPPAAPRRSRSSIAPSRSSTRSSSCGPSTASARRSRRIRPARWLNGASRSAGGAIPSPPASVRPGRCSRGATPSSARGRLARRPTGSGRMWTRCPGCTPILRRRIRPPACGRIAMAMSKVAAAYPNDSEASIFYALSIAAAASPADKTFADQLKAGAILEKLIARQPDHPGLAHYIIHTYDVPPLADRALEAARRYAKIAPSAPHALHMPSHTFTRLGYWQESIDTNTASGAVAKRDGSVAEELHAMDYRIYAYLQTAQDRGARRMLDALPEVAARFDPDAVGSAAPGSAGVFALAAIPARYALERAARGPRPRSSSRTRASSRTPRRSRTSRARSAPRISATRRPSAPPSRRCRKSRISSRWQRKLLGRADRDSTALRIGMARLRGTA